MKKKKKKFEHPICVIWWDDATHLCEGEDREKELEPSPLVTVGFLLRETKAYVTLYQEFDEDSKWVRHKSTIPKRMIKDMHVWELS